jgi:uncharacterized damage-inducible protein DinB
MDAVNHFSFLARYNVWATKRLLKACEPLSDEQYRRDVGLFFKSIHGTLNHLLVGEHLLWYPRFAKGISTWKPSLTVNASRKRLEVALRIGCL